MSYIAPYVAPLGYADLAYGGAAMASMYSPYSVARYGYGSYSRPWGYNSLYGGSIYGGYGGYGYSGYRWPSMF
ncbi:hypothetical protein FFLO_06451 [Filobasidium floriforme]|uniref:Uncharacterized protein n=1 Tax=Filobasidium floriforme TaxID=5210 RepID=A0A8K0NN02_9TREE|nr:hypothetical protein FFLO_06451 [Filobasidium floriforme]